MKPLLNLISKLSLLLLKQKKDQLSIKGRQRMLSIIFPTSCNYLVFDAVTLAVLIMYVLGFPKKIYFCGPILLTYLSRD